MACRKILKVPRPLLRATPTFKVPCPPFKQSFDGAILTSRFDNYLYFRPSQKHRIGPYQGNYLFIIPSLSNFWPKAKKLFIFCACMRCTLIRIKMCTN